MTQFGKNPRDVIADFGDFNPRKFAAFAPIGIVLGLVVIGLFTSYYTVTTPCNRKSRRW